MIYSYIVDDVDPSASRIKVREKLNEVLARPFDPQELADYEHDQAVRANVAQMERLGDRYEAKPRVGPPPQRPGTVPVP